ncbi:AAA family ATPase [Trinickia mobilis]|uniref:AAA family ATPase n=1 Tax=Trinickia mobilis TaxID=2816356 RepID=UPI001A8E345B|nr:AAA family ATPase [Trinickia mobilis]
MILLELQLHNFRQFFGSSPVIKFSQGKKNVTVIHATNGGGKTTFLNAFTWTLYDAVSKGFLFPDQIINKRAIREAAPGSTINAWVHLKFEHLGREYSLRKMVDAIRGDSDTEVVSKGEPRREFMWTDESGTWRPETNIADVIGRVLPQDLHTYFFFDGERIERIVQPSAEDQANIANATKKILGLEVVERAIRHLTSAKKTLERELEVVGDETTKGILRKKSQIEEELRAVEETFAQTERNLKGFRLRQRELSKRLGQLEDIKSDQARRDHLNGEHRTYSDALDTTKQQLNELVNADGYKVFLGDVSDTYLNLIENLRQKGELPAGIKRQFVDDLLNRGECICERTLNPSVDHIAHCAVERWKQRAGLVDVEDKAIRMGGEVRRIRLDQDTFWDQSEAFQKRIAGDREQIKRIESELEAIHLRLQGSPREEVQDLERQHTEAGENIERANQTIGSSNTLKRGLEDQLAECEAALRKSQQNEEKQRLAQRRLNATTDAVARLAESKGRFEETFRRTLTDKVRSIFGKISYTPYVPEITEGYSLRLLEGAGGSMLPVAASQGENQILSLAFIGAVIDVAREFTRSKERLPGPEASTYPVVMDSPFGSLGPTYRTQVAENITALADQVVLMVTNTQWLGEVETALGARIGKSYVVEYSTPRDGVPNEPLDIGTSRYELVTSSPNEFEYSTIREVDRG